MSTKELFDLIAISTGAGIMAVSIHRAWGLRQAVQSAGYCNLLRVLLLLMKFFLLGYLLSVWAIFTHGTPYLYSMVALVYLFGSVFVLLTMWLAQRTSEQLRRYNVELEKLVEERTAELHRALQEQQSARQRFAQLFAEMPAACFTYDRNGIILDWNSECARLYGMSADEVIGKSMFELFVRPEDAEPTREVIEQVFAGQSVRNIEWCDTTSSGATRWVLCNTFPLFDANGRVTAGISANIDITERKLQEQLIEQQRDELEAQNASLQQVTMRLAEANAQMERMASTDAMTGLPNHRVFRERLWREYLWSLEHDRPLSLMMLDIDHFKQFNDSYGHQAGDEVLRKVAGVLEQTCSEGQFAARYGGEEFAVILPLADRASAVAFAERVREAIAGVPCCYRQITASIGVATLALHTLNPDTLIEEADQALYVSKRNGRNRVSHAEDHHLLITDIPAEQWLTRVQEAVADPNGFASHRVTSQIVFDHLQMLRRARARLGGVLIPLGGGETGCRFEVWAQMAKGVVPEAEMVIEQHERLCSLLRQMQSEPSARLLAEIEQQTRMFTNALRDILAISQLAA